MKEFIYNLVLRALPKDAVYFDHRGFILCESRCGGEEWEESFVAWIDYIF